MKSILAATAFAIVALSGGVSTANASPAGVLQSLKNNTGAVEQVGWRQRKRCWWSHGHRHCR